MQIVCKSCSNRDKPSVIEYIRALLVHTRATFESQSYQLISRHGWSSILVPVNPCITEYTVLEPCAQPCSVSDRLKDRAYICLSQIICYIAIQWHRVSFVFIWQIYSKPCIFRVPSWQYSYHCIGISIFSISIYNQVMFNSCCQLIH